MPASSGSRRQLVVEAIYDGSSINQGVRPSQQAIRGLSEDVQRVSNEFRLGAISADKYADEMLGIRNSAVDMAQGLNRSSQEYRELTSAAIRADNELDKFGRTANRSTSAVDLLKGGLATLGVAFGVQEVLRFGNEIGQMAEGADKTTRALNALSGGQAALSVSSLTTALDGSISKMGAATLASSLFATGVADSAAEAAHFAEVAATLGSTVGTGTVASIENLRLALDNTSWDRLGELGLSADAVRVRVNELTASGLALGEAFKLATMEQAEARFAQLEAAGVTAGTSTDRLNSAWSNLSLTLGEQVSPAYQGATDALAQGITYIDQNAESIIRFDQTARNLLNPLTGVTQALTAQAEANDKAAGSVFRQTTEMEKQINSASRGIGVANIFGDALLFVGDAADVAASNIPRLRAEAAYLSNSFYGVTLSANAAAIAIGNAFGASADRFNALRNKAGGELFRFGDGGGTGLRGGIEDIFETQQEAFRATQVAATRAAGSGVSAAEKAAKEQERIAKDIAADYEREFGRIGGFVDRALSFNTSVGQNDALLDRFGLRNQNSSDELVRQIQDVADRASEGNRSPWLDLFPELDATTTDEIRARALRLIDDLQSGLRTDLLNRDAVKADVMELITAERQAKDFRDSITQELLASGAASSTELDKALTATLGTAGQTAGTEVGVSINNAILAEIEASTAMYEGGGFKAGVAFKQGVLRGAVGGGAEIAILYADEFSEAVEGMG